MGATPVRPLAITNVLNYLQGCLEHEEVKGQTFDIGDPDILTYRQLFDLYAEEAGLPTRLLIPVPVLTPRLSSYWIHLITPVPAAIARPVAEGLRNPVVCQDHRIRQIIPRDPSPVGRSSDGRGRKSGSSRWTPGPRCRRGGSTVATPNMPGAPGFLRGYLDRLAGDIGFRAGRRHPEELAPGDALDFWRVLEVQPPPRLLLLAEMKLPGEAVPEFRLTPLGEGDMELRQAARFLPRGQAAFSTAIPSPLCTRGSTRTCSWLWPRKQGGKFCGGPRPSLIPGQPFFP